MESQGRPGTDQGERPGTEATGRTTEPQKDLAEERLASLRSHKPSGRMEEPSREIGDTDTEALIREARAGINSRAYKGGNPYQSSFTADTGTYRLCADKVVCKRVYEVKRVLLN